MAEHVPVDSTMYKPGRVPVRKLIRDKIAANILQENNEQSCVVYQIDNDDEFSALLAAKLDEEVGELKRERVLANIVEEAADVLQVLTSIVEFIGFSEHDLLVAYRKKYHQCGGFENRYVLSREA